MREIKFRAWNAGHKEMVYFDFYGVDDNCCYAGKHLIHDLDEVPVMQYTGLKDKNGKEIYEGDIVKGQHLDGHEYVCEVRFVENGCFSFITSVFKGTGNYAFFTWDLGGKEVIGNIYENPELLKVKE